MSKKVRWGILGTGRIAKAFAEGLKYTSNGQLTAVGSRSKATSESFASEWLIPHFYDSYDKLAASPEVDAIYIATPHSAHAQNALICMDHSKAVLCEKPFAVNALQVEQMIEKARVQDVLLMEGMWSRFPPLMNKVREIIANNEIGEIRSIHADFGFKPEEKNLDGRLFNPDLAGGSLLDVGIYPVSLSFMLNGKPDSFKASGQKEKPGWTSKHH